MEEKILELIKKYDNIIIARHIGGDPDALGSSFALKDIIEYNFSNKNVHVTGSPISRFRFFGQHEKITEEMYENALLIALDIPDIRRLDGVDISKFTDVIKIDHHPEIDKFSDTELIDVNASSTCEMIAKLSYKLNLKIPDYAAEKIFIGIVADTNRFLFLCSTSNTYKIVARLIDENNIVPGELYEKLYKRNMTEVRLEGYISQNLIITKNGAAYIKITDEDLKKINVDSASVGSIMNNYNYIEGVYTWVVFTEDLKAGVIRTSARSRGPIINKLFEQYNGGGHIYACGAKLHDFKEADEIIDKLDELCYEYNKDEI